MNPNTTIPSHLKRFISRESDDEEKNPNKKMKTSKNWCQGLKQTLQNKNNVILETDLVSVIKDKYPKAKYHYLIIVKAENISSVKSLNQGHVDLLKHMLEVAAELEDPIKRTDNSVVFKEGFHAVPSMTLMHMHVISTDFDSVHLKHKRHWNSFTTDFFRPARLILQQLEKEGRIHSDNIYYKRMLEIPLKCHICDIMPKNMPRLKEHIRTHFN